MYFYSTGWMGSGLDDNGEYHFILFLIDEFKKQELPTDKDMEEIADDWGCFLNTNNQQNLRTRWREQHVRPFTPEEQAEREAKGMATCGSKVG